MRKTRKGTNFRAQWWDYRNNGAYFITINTLNRKHYFGKIQNGEMHLSSVGVIADILWWELQNRIPYVFLGAYVIMPDHMHGVLIINQQEELPNVETASEFRELYPRAGSVPAIIRGYKGAVTRHTRRLGYDFAWQPRYHDKIIRGEEMLRRVEQYIQNNPRNWKP